MRSYRPQPRNQQPYSHSPALHGPQPPFACPHPACRIYTSRSTTYRPHNSIPQVSNMSQHTPASEPQDTFEVSPPVSKKAWNHTDVRPLTKTNEPFTYSPHASEPYIAYDCHCAQCTQHAETGWSTFIDQGVTGPWQYYSEPSRLFYPYGTGPVYHPHHLGHQATTIDRSDTGAAGHFEPTGGPQDQGISPHKSEEASLVAPSEVLYRHSPVPTLSECSTRSTSSSLRSSFGSMGWDERQILHSVPASSQPWGSFEPNGLYMDHTISCQPPALEAPIPQRSYPHALAADRSFFETSDSSYSFRSPSYTPEPEHEDHTGSAQQADFTEKDELLVRWKMQGMSYKDIKAKGRFKEAESTLRGRFRALTKDKQQRIRKPRWTKRDVRLLREGVNKLSVQVVTHTSTVSKTSANGTNTRKGKTPGSQLKRSIKLRTPWKDVAKYIIESGGTYHYGNATCRKKWDEVVEVEGGGLDQRSRVIELDDDADDDQGGAEDADADDTEVDADT